MSISGLSTARAWLIAAVIMTTVLLAGTAPAYAVKNVDSVWKSHGAAVGVWNQDPGSGLWTTLDLGVSDDPYGYRFQLACADDDGNLRIGCNTAAAARCDDEEDGQLVQWFRGLRELGRSAWNSPFGEPSCVYSTKPEDVLDLIAQRILSDLRTLPVEAGEVSLEPSPHTLLGAETNVYAVASQQVFDINILGQEVALVATPVEYTWSYGDGTRHGPTPYPGGPLPQSRWGEKTQTSHIYGETGDFQVSLTTTFSGTYSVNGGPALPIPGTGSFTADPVTISVWRSVVNNFADNCFENPNGAGC